MTVRTFLLFVSIVLTFKLEAFNNYDGSCPNKYVSDEVWESVKEHLIPNNHPIKKILDSIFSKSRALLDMESLMEAGFDFAIPQHHTKIIVTRHRNLNGYVIKAYLDEQEYHGDMPEYYYWIKRVIGSELVRKSLIEHEYTHLFKVPKKWIYLLPDDPSPPKKYLRKNFILVEEDMNLIHNKMNLEMWRSEVVTKDFLFALFTVLTEVGLWDCAKPSNCAFSLDGKAAFFDTPTHSKRCVKYHSLLPFLTPKMRKYWSKLMRSKESIPCRRLPKKK